MSENKVPAETLELPSKGWFYPLTSPLAKGSIEIYHMTARHEDILTSRNLIVKGIVLDKLLEALIATPEVKIEDLLIGDKNGIMIGARILGYGRKYPIQIQCPGCTQKIDQEIDLQALDDVPIELNDSQRGSVEFNYVLPICQKNITFRLLTHGDDLKIRKELEGMRKALKSDITTEVTTRMKYAITAVDGEDDREKIRLFVNDMPAQDARAFRKHSIDITPNIDLSFDFECPNCGYKDRSEVPIDHTFFWPQS